MIYVEGCAQSRGVQWLLAFLRFIFEGCNVPGIIPTSYSAGYFRRTLRSLT